MIDFEIEEKTYDLRRVIYYVLIVNRIACCSRPKCRVIATHINLKVVAGEKPISIISLSNGELSVDDEISDNEIDDFMSWIRLALIDTLKSSKHNRLNYLIVRQNIIANLEDGFISEQTVAKIDIGDILAAYHTYRLKQNLISFRNKISRTPRLDEVYEIIKHLLVPNKHCSQPRLRLRIPTEIKPRLRLRIPTEIKYIGSRPDGSLLSWHYYFISDGVIFSAWSTLPENIIKEVMFNPELIHSINTTSVRDKLIYLNITLSIPSIYKEI